VRTDSAIDEKLKKVGAQHIPVVIMVLLTLVAAHHQTANPAMGQQRLVDREVCEVGLDRRALLRIQRLTGLQSVEGSRRITRIVGERIWRQAWWEVVAHASTLASAAGIAPGNTSPSR